MTEDAKNAAEGANMPSGAGSDPGALSSDEKMWAMLTHLSALSAILTGLGFILGPLIVWLIKKDEMPFVDRHGKSSLNFQISFAIYGFISFLLIFIGIGLLLMPVVGVAWLVLTIVASLKANNGEEYKYPLTIEFLK